VKLTVVGCSGSAPGPDSPASAYLVEQDGYTLLLDLGSGAFGALQRYADPAAIDAVVLSHLHADHCLDLCPYVVFRRFGPLAGTLPKLPVLGPAGTADRIAMAYDPTSREGVRDVFGFTGIVPGERELGPFRLKFERMNHPVETYGVRLEATGRTLAYSGDTGSTEALVELARGADALLCEAAFADGTPDLPANLHLTGSEAGQHAAKAGVGRLLVTHIPPWEDAARITADAATAFGGRTDRVTPGAVYEI
jgi:ribonuclease BN (tRNA processing enzyme)